jgi:hypothetical protein
MILKPQDIVVILKIISFAGQTWTYSLLAHELYMSPSEVHASTKRLAKSRLMDFERKEPFKKALEEYLIHGVKYAYPPERVGSTRGIVTSYAAPPLAGLIEQGADLPVWPYSEGDVRGQGFLPLYKTVPAAALIDLKLYEFLSLIDAIRDGQAREGGLAIIELKKRL